MQGVPVRRRRSVVVLSCSSIVIALVAIASAAAGPKGTPTLTIGMINSATGSSAVTCTPEQNGAKLALALAQKARWFPHTLVKLDIQDDSSTAAGGVTAFRNIADSGDVAIGGVCNGVGATPIEQLIDQVKIPEVISTAGTPDLVGPEWAFRAGIPQYYFDHLVGGVLKDAGAKTAYIIHASDSPTLQFLWQSVFPRAFTAYGIKIVGDFTVNATTVDFGPAIKQIQSLNPDAIGLLIIGGQTLPATTQIRNAGLNQKIFGQSSMGTNAWISAGPLTDGSVWGTNYSTSFTYPSSVAFTKAYKSVYGSDPTNIAANGYDAVLRVLLAIKSVGPEKLTKMSSTGDRRGAIYKALLTQKVIKGAQGPMTVTENGDVRGPAGVVQLKNGVPTLMHPKPLSKKTSK